MGLSEFLGQLPEDDTAPIRYASLAELSAIPERDARDLARRWRQWPADRVVELLRKLSGLAEDDVLLEFDTVLKQALSHSEANARLLAIQGLTESTDRSLVPRFAQILREDPTPEVRAAAAMGMARFATWACEGRLIPRDCDRIRGALFDALERAEETEEVRRRALESVAPFGGTEIDERIRHAYLTGDTLLVQSSLFAMGRTMNADWIEYVLEGLESTVAAHRFEAARALGEIGDERHAAYLGDLLDDNDTQVAVAAATSLGKMGGARAKSLLKSALESDQVAVAEAAQVALGEVEQDDLLFENEAGVLGIRPEVLLGGGSDNENDDGEDDSDLDEFQTISLN